MYHSGPVLQQIINRNCAITHSRISAVMRNRIYALVRCNRIVLGMNQANGCLLLAIVR